MNLKALLANKAALAGVAGVGGVAVLALRRRAAAQAGAAASAPSRLLGVPVPQTFFGAGAGPTPNPPATSPTPAPDNYVDPALLAAAMDAHLRPFVAPTTQINAPLTNNTVPWSPVPATTSTAVANMARGFSPVSTPAQGATRSWLSIAPARSVGG